MKRKLSLTEQLRGRLASRVGACPECGKPAESLRDVAALIGVSHSTLWRFLKGRGLSSGVADALNEFLKEN